MFCAKIPKYIKKGHIKLRPLKVSDGLFMKNGFRDKKIMKANGLSKPLSGPWFLVWWWLRRTFTLSYCILTESRRIGFIGLYNLSLGKSTEITLLILDENSRGKGYGSKAFSMISEMLKQYGLVKKITVKIKKDNHEAIYFWSKLGFEQLTSLNGIIIMSIDLNQYSVGDRFVHDQKKYKGQKTKLNQTLTRYRLHNQPRSPKGQAISCSSRR